MSVFFYGCISLDGYLSGKNHDLSWLYESGSPEETSYEEFYKSMDIAIMGRNTFNEVSKMGSISEIYPSTTNYVFTSHDDINTDSVTAISGSLADFIETIDKNKNIWIVGGGGILSTLLNENLVDKMYIQVAPVIIGEGIRLFQNKELSKRFKLLDVKQYGQFAELIYGKI